ncbi:MAG: hypothetical protein AAF281_06865 [Pseudomonadota bacterium]
MTTHQPLLQAHTVLRTTELDAARAAVAEKYCDHRLTLASGLKADVVHNHVRGADLSLNVLQYGADVAINPGELQDFYLLQLPLAGHAEVHHRGEAVDASPRFGTLLNPDRPTTMRWRDGCRKLMVQVDAAFLGRVACEEIGGEIPGPVRFDPKVALTRPGGRRLRALSLAAVRAVDAGDVTPSAQDLTMLALERTLVATMLETQPSNVSHLFGHRRAV